MNTPGRGENQFPSSSPGWRKLPLRSEWCLNPAPTPLRTLTRCLSSGLVPLRQRRSRSAMPVVPAPPLLRRRLLWHLFRGRTWPPSLPSASGLPGPAALLTSRGHASPASASSVACITPFLHARGLSDIKTSGPLAIIIRKHPLSAASLLFYTPFYVTRVTREILPQSLCRGAGV